MKIKPAIELHDKNLGILGYGRVGKMVEKISKPLFKKVTGPIGPIFLELESGSIGPKKALSF